MRKRSNTTNSKVQPKPQDLKRQFQTLKMEHSILQSKHEELKSQRDILKEGNANLINEFLFDKHRNENNKLSDALKQKTHQNTEIKKILEQIDKILKGVICSSNMNSYLREKQISINFEHSNNFTVRMPDQNLFQSFWGKKAEINSKQVKENAVKLRQSYDKEFALNKQLEQQNIQLGKEIQFLRANLEQISNDIQRSVPEQLLTNNEELMHKIEDISQELNSLKSQNIHLSELLKKTQEQSKSKEKQMIAQNKELSERIKQLDRQVKLRKSSFENNDSKLSSFAFKQTRFHDSDINMSVSICNSNSDEMKRSLIYQKLSESCMQQSVVTESYDKRVNKLEKTNASLEKDNRNSQQKIKSINREYSKLKLDYLKLSEEWKIREDELEKRVQILKDKLQTANKKNIEHQNTFSSFKNEKERQKLTYKSLIISLESQQTESQNTIEKNKIEIQDLKKQLQQAKMIQQTSNLNNIELQNEKNKNSILEKTVKDYKTIIQDMRKMEVLQKSDSKEKHFSRKDKKSLQRKQGSSPPLSSPFKKYNQSSSEIHLQIQSDSILRTLMNQIQVLETNLKLQNERYNVLENSNSQLRKQLLKMIDHEEKLRKDLINQRIKTKTKSISSKNGKSFISRRLKQDFSEEKNQMKMNHCESNLYLQIGSNVKGQYRQRNNTQRSFQSVQRKKRLYSSNSNSQLVINVNRGNASEGVDYENKTNVSNLKALRERRFDPQETSNAVVVKESHLAERIPVYNIRSRQNSFEKNSGQISRFSLQDQQKSPLKGQKQENERQGQPFVANISPVVNKFSKKVGNEFSQTALSPIRKKNDNGGNSAKTKQSLNAQAHSQKDEKQEKKLLNKQDNEKEKVQENKQVKKYVYQPPKKYIPGLKMVTSITKDMLASVTNQSQIDHMVTPKRNHNDTIQDQKDQQLISSSNEYNKEITLEISSSKSNRSRVDMILEPVRVESLYEQKNRSSNRSLKEPKTQRKVQSTDPFDDHFSKQPKNNIAMAGKINSTKSNAEPRFMRKH